MSVPVVHLRNQGYLQQVKVSPGKGNFDGFKLSEALDDLNGAIGNAHYQLASNPAGVAVVPPTVGAIDAKHLGNGIVNFAITDNGKIQRAIDYYVEIADNPGFSGAEVVHASPSRNGRTILPNGTWYVKAYSQYRYGGTPSPGVTTGPVVVSGSVNAELLGSQGCGTAKPGVTGQGAGLVISR